MFLNGFEISIIIKTQKKSFFKSKFDSEMEHQLRHETQVGIPLSQCLKITQGIAFEFWHFLLIFVLLTCLVTLFDRKL